MSSNRPNDEKTRTLDCAAVVENMVVRLKAFEALTYRDCANGWQELKSAWPSDEPGLGLWDAMVDIYNGWIEKELESLGDGELLEIWETSAPVGWEDKVFWESGSPPSDYPEPSECPRWEQVRLLIDVIRQKLFWRAEQEASDDWFAEEEAPFDEEE